MKIKILLLTLLSLSSFALTCPKDRSLNDIVMDMIKLDLSGVRVDGLENGRCLKTADHPYALIVQDASNEQSSQPNFTVADESKIKILEVKLKDSDTFAYEAIVEFEVNSEKEGKKVIKDKYLFFLNKDASVQKNHGCFSVLDYPENILVFKKCLN